MFPDPFQQDISAASDEAARKYIEETDKEDRSDAEITRVMREAARAKAGQFRGTFSKYTAVANPKLGDQFLEEVEHVTKCLCYRCRSLLL